jgi:tetratricopeptide (TPR) repeat protein
MSGGVPSNKKGLIFIDNDTLTIMLECGFLLGTLKRHESAEKVFRGVLAICPENEAALLGLGNILLVQGQPGNAEQCYKNLIKIKPNHPAANAYLGELMLGSGRQEEAMRYLNHALRFDRTGPSGQMARQLLKLSETGFFAGQ